MRLDRSTRFMARVVGVSLLLAGVTALALAADCNGNGFQDGDDLASERSADCNGNFHPDECDVEEANLVLTSPRLIFPPHVFRMAAADMDGDGDVDLAGLSALGVAEGEASSGERFGVFRNEGNAVLSTLEALPLPRDLRSLFAGDLDADGKADLAGAVFSGVEVLFGSGAARFDPPLALRIGSDPLSLEAGDVNGDGALDLVTGNQLGNVSVLVSSGARAFSISNFTGGRSSLDIDLADLDGDGDLDVAWAEEGRVVLLANDGSGRYLEAASVEASGGFPQMQQILAARDFDGDGDTDLALAIQKLFFFWNQDGAWQEWDSGFAADTLAAGDLDRDGAQDLACASFSLDILSRFILLDQGRGSFRSSFAEVATFAFVLLVADLDGDATNDVIASTGSGLEFHASRRQRLGEDCNRNHVPDECEDDCDRNGIPDACDLRDGKLDDCDGNGIADACESDCDLNGTPDACDIASGASPDCDRNGIPDSCDAGRLDCDRNGVLDPCEREEPADCNANGEPDACDLSPNLRLGLSSHALGEPPAALATGDLDGDGRSDLVVGHPARRRRLTILRGGADLRFAAAELFAAESELVATGDFDGDGDLDVAASAAGVVEGSQAGVVLLRNQGGRMSRRNKVAFPAGVNALLAADLDRNGSVNLVVAAGDAVRVIDIEGARVTSRKLAAVDSGALAAADFDGDGDQDLATATAGLLIQQAPGDFRPGWGGALAIKALLAADFDGDGDVDIAGDAQGLNWNDGTGRFAQGQQLLSPGVSFEGQVDLAALDLDGDSDLDIAGVAAGHLILFANGGQGRFGGEEARGVGRGPVALAVADLDGNGSLDLAVANEHSASVAVLNPEAALAKNAYPMDVKGFCLGDLDGDADLDLAAAGQQSASGALVRLFENTRSALFREQPPREVDGGEQGVAAGDLDGDGAVDLVVADRLPGRLLVLRNQGLWEFSAPEEIPTPGGPDLVLIDDLDADGDDDLAAGGPSNTGAFLTTFLNDGAAGFARGTVFEFSPFLKTVLAVDSDGDGDLDLAALRSRFPDAEVQLFVNAGRGEFGPVPGFRVAAEIASVTAGDLDGDGDADLLAGMVQCDDCGGGRLCDCRARLLVLRNDGTGGFREETEDLAPFPDAVALADLDGDADLDLLVPQTRLLVRTSWIPGFEVEVLTNTGRQFEAGQKFFAGEGPFAVEAADLDGSGLPDVAVLARDGLSIHRNGTAVRSADVDRNGIPDECETDRFRRGDADTDGVLNLTDAIHLLRHLFAAGERVRCPRAADADDDGSMSLTDAVGILLHLFAGAALPPPAPECGPDPTPDALSCAYPPCA